MEIKNKKDIFKKYHTLEEITLEHEGVEIKRERLLRPEAVAALVYDTEKNEFIFVKQFRPGVLSDIIEIPAGLLDKENESKVDALKRELLEEIGYDIDECELLVDTYYSSVGYTNEKLTIYYCEVSKMVEKGGGVDNENIEIVRMTPEEFYDYKFVDSKSIMSRLAFIQKLYSTI